MKIVFLHGAPAVGKLAVATALQRRLGAKVMDNHASIDFARKLFDFGTPAFWFLVNKLRRDAVQAAALYDLPLLVLTLCYCHPHDEVVLQQIMQDASLSPSGSELLPVFLHCPDAVAEERLVSAERVARGKLTSVEQRREFVTWNDFRAVTQDTCLSLDTAAMEPDDAAAIIAHHFNLRPVPAPEPGLPQSLDQQDEAP